MYLLVECAVLVGTLSVDPGLLYSPVECIALKRTPAAFAEYVFRFDCEATVLVEYDQVGVISRENLTAFQIILICGNYSPD